MKLAPALLAVLVLLTACGSDEDPTLSGVPATPTTTTSAPAAACSAAGRGPAAAQEGLPAAVAETRDAIVGAATSCDIDALAAINPEVAFSFGGGDAASHWRSEEDAGREPLRFLVELVDGPHARTSDGTYVWPAAFARPSWDEVTAEERDELRALYSDDELEQFATFGAYIGLRVGISEAGEWLFFIAGD